jgi:alcohol dehydrogenase (cytochrome c)
VNLTYWGVGNPGPDWNPDQRPGDNLYTDSVVALDPDTGKLKWHYQFTPNDAYDYDSVQVPVLADLMWKGSLTKAMLWGNRNGNFYVLDRETGKFLSGTPFVKVTWMNGFDEGGRPIQTPQPAGMPTYPGVQGGTNWYSPSYSPRTGLFYLSAWENYGSIYRKEPVEYEPGRRFNGGAGATVKPVPDAPVMPGPAAVRSPINTWTNLVGNGAVIAIDPKTGQAKWKFQMYDVTDAGILTTAGDVLFTGGREGYFHALDARTGSVLWKTYLGGPIMSAPVTYAIDGKQYVIVNSGNVMVTFGLRE